MTDRGDVDELFDEEVIADGFFHFHCLKRGINALQENVRMINRIAAIQTLRHRRHALSALCILYRHAAIRRHDKANQLVADGMARARAFLNAISTWRRVTKLSRKTNAMRIQRAIIAWRLFRNDTIQLLIFQRATLQRSLHRFTKLWAINARVMKQQRTTVHFNLISLRRVVLKRALRRWLKHTLQSHVITSTIYLTHTRTAQRFVLLLRKQTHNTRLTHTESVRIIASTSLRLIRKWRMQNEETRTRSLINMSRLRRFLFQWRMSTKLRIQMAAKAANFIILTRAFNVSSIKRRYRKTLHSWNEAIKLIKQRRFQIISDSLLLWRCYAVRKGKMRVASSVLSATIARHIIERAFQRVSIAARRSFINQCCLTKISIEALPALLYIRSRLNFWRKWAKLRRLAGRLLLEKIDLSGKNVKINYCITDHLGPTSSPHNDADFDPFAHVADDLDRAYQCFVSQRVESPRSAAT
jgi:hypothetical protein